MKTKEELNALKEEVETVSKKLHELTNDDLEKVAGGSADDICPFCGMNLSELSPLFQKQHKMCCERKK